MITQPLRKPAAILFDFGDTVLRTVTWDPLSGNARLLELAENRNGVSPEVIQELADEIRAEADICMNEAMIEFGFQSFQHMLFAMLDLKANVEKDELEEEFWNAAVAHEPAEGIHDVLDALRRFGIEAAIVSNNSFTGKVLERELSAHQLLDHFKFVISSVDFGFRKPHRRIFDLAVKKLGFDPSDIWFIGDKVEYDVIGARDAGLIPVWYNYRNEPTMQVDCLEVKTWHEFEQKLNSVCQG